MLWINICMLELFGWPPFLMVDLHHGSQNACAYPIPFHILCPSSGFIPWPLPEQWLIWSKTWRSLVPANLSFRQSHLQSWKLWAWSGMRILICGVLLDLTSCTNIYVGRSGWKSRLNSDHSFPTKFRCFRWGNQSQGSRDRWKIMVDHSLLSTLWNFSTCKCRVWS